jgi:hypothetical protein
MRSLCRRDSPALEKPLTNDTFPCTASSAIGGASSCLRAAAASRLSLKRLDSSHVLAWQMQSSELFCKWQGFRCPFRAALSSRYKQPPAEAPSSNLVARIACRLQVVCTYVCAWRAEERGGDPRLLAPCPFGGLRKWRAARPLYLFWRLGRRHRRRRHHRRLTAA